MAATPRRCVTCGDSLSAGTTKRFNRQNQCDLCIDDDRHREKQQMIAFGVREGYQRIPDSLSGWRKTLHRPSGGTGEG